MQIRVEDGRLVLDLEGAEFDFVDAPGFTHNDIFLPGLLLRNGVFRNSITGVPEGVSNATQK